MVATFFGRFFSQILNKPELDGWSNKLQEVIAHKLLASDEYENLVFFHPADPRGIT